MITFNLTVFFNVKVSLFSDFFYPVMSFFFILVTDLFVIIFYFFRLFFSFLFFFFFGWGGLGYIFGRDLTSYCLILLSLWICVLIILARESIFRFGYFSGSFYFCYSCYNYVASYVVMLQVCWQLASKLSANLYDMYHIYPYLLRHLSLFCAWNTSLRIFSVL